MAYLRHSAVLGKAGHQRIFLQHDDGAEVGSYPGFPRRIGTVLFMWTEGVGAAPARGERTSS